ncbi:uncharacterized protein [Typha latifolia]|uniref:uncharacterized protein n=1 Tax=Typha latifolia TaxID=4733 RepID=UPI003C2ACC89
MLTHRLFLPRLPHLHAAPFPRRQPQLRTLATVTRFKNKKKKEPLPPPPPPPTPATALDRLKRRTRSATEFDFDLYRRHVDCHVPVMLNEVLQAFYGCELNSFVDCTLGAGGHSSALIEAHGEMELFVGMDVDPKAHDMARVRIEAAMDANSCGGRLRAYTHVRNFKYIKSVLTGVDENILNSGVDGILMDLGLSSMQVDQSERGFSVLCDGPLDMRMSPQASLKAEDILNSWPELEVGRILREYGEESNWQFLQKKIVNARASGGLHSTRELVELVRRTSSKSGGRQGWIKTATRVFQALRIAVNDELQILEDALYACFDCLSSGGRLAVISFHSLEDRIVKQTYLNIIKRGEIDVDGERCESKQQNETDGEGETWAKNRVRGSSGTILTKRPITPSEEEEKLNRRCRSAKLRVLQKA